MREAIFFSPPLDAIGSVTSITHNRARASRNHMQGGIKFFAGERTPDLETLSSIPIPVTAENLLNNHAVWWPEATIEAAHPFFKHGKVNVVGGPQSGKGTILFGLSEICETADWRYAFIDGHFQNTPAQEVVAAIRAAQQQGAVILFDSFDYLFAGSRRMRSISRANQSVRTEPSLRRWIR